jgi:hypothetical protein
VQQGFFLLHRYASYTTNIHISSTAPPHNPSSIPSHIESNTLLRLCQIFTRDSALIVAHPIDSICGQYQLLEANRAH